MTPVPSFAVGPRIEALISESIGPVLVVAPFISRGAFEKLLQMVTERPLRIITDWPPAAVAAKATDPRILDSVLSRPDTELRLLSALHAKLFWTRSGALVGSANLTLRGTGWGGVSNFELLVRIPHDDPDVVDFVKLADGRSRVAETADADAALYAASRIEATTTQDLEVHYEHPDSGVPMLRHLPGDVIRAHLREIEPTPTLQADLALLRMQEGMTTSETIEHLRRTLRALPHYAVATKVADLTVGAPTADRQVKTFVDIAETSGLRLHADEDPAAAWERLMVWMTTILSRDFAKDKPGKPYLVRKGVF